MSELDASIFEWCGNTGVYRKRLLPNGETVVGMSGGIYVLSGDTGTRILFIYQRGVDEFRNSCGCMLYQSLCQKFKLRFEPPQ